MYNSYSHADMPTCHDKSESGVAEEICDSADVRLQFINLARRMEEMDEPERADTVRQMMKEASVDSISFRTLFDNAEHYFGDFGSFLHNDSFYIPFLEEALRYPIFNDSEKERLNFILEMSGKNRPGIKAADFRFVKRDGCETSLHNLSSAGMMLLIFYDPDCNHCMEMFDQIRTSAFPVSLQIVAIDAENDHFLWDSTKNNLPKEWTVGFATEPIQDEDTYILQSSPTIYLLDSDKYVILKDATLQQVIDFCLKKY